MGEDTPREKDGPKVRGIQRPGEGGAWGSPLSIGPTHEYVAVCAAAGATYCLLGALLGTPVETT